MNIINRINRYPSPFWADLDQLFQRTLSRPTGAASERDFQFSESQDGWTLRTDLPGYAKEDVTVAVEEGLLKLTARVTDDNPGFVPGFDHRLRLPKQVDRSKITAGLNHGILEVTLPKHPEEQSREIHIDVK